MKIDDAVSATCHSHVLILALNTCFLAGGVAIAVLSKSLADNAVNDIRVKFQDLSMYFDDWDVYLNTFQSVYGIFLMAFGSTVAGSAVVGAVAFWFRIKFLVIIYMIFIIFAILAEYVFGALLLIYSKKDHFPVAGDTIEKEIMDALDQGYCDDSDLGLSEDISSYSSIVDLFRSAPGATLVSSLANEQLSECPVYTSGMDCEKAKQECTSAITKFLLTHVGPIGMWLCIVASGMVIVCLVAVYFLFEHHLWLSRKRSEEIRKVLGRDTLVRHVTIQAMYQAKSDGTFHNLSPLSSLKKSLPPAIAQDSSLLDLEDGSPGTYVSAVEDTLSVHGSTNLSATSFASKSKSRNSKLAKMLTADFNRQSSTVSGSDHLNAPFATARVKRRGSTGTNTSGSGDLSREGSHDTVISLGKVSAVSGAMAKKRLDREKTMHSITSSIVLPPGFTRGSSLDSGYSSKAPVRESFVVVDVQAKPNSSKPPSVGRVSFADSLNDSRKSSNAGQAGQRVGVAALAGWWGGEKVGRLAKHPGVDDGDSESDMSINEDDFSPNNRSAPTVFTNTPSATPAGTVTSRNNNSFGFAPSIATEDSMPVLGYVLQNNDYLNVSQRSLNGDIENCVSDSAGGDAHKSFVELERLEAGSKK